MNGPGEPYEWFICFAKVYVSARAEWHTQSPYTSRNLQWLAVNSTVVLCGLGTLQLH